MEIKIDRSELLKSVSRVQSILERRSNMPILSTVLLNAKEGTVNVSATDLELGFRQTIAAEIIDPGNIAISGRKLFEILKESNSQEFHIKEKENNWVHLTDKVARFDLACLPADEYPTFMEPENVTMVEVPGAVLSEMINKTIYSVTVEDAGFKLSGVFTEKVEKGGATYIRMVSTDGHRLSMIDKSLPGIDALDLGSGVMIPKKGMNELNKFTAEEASVNLGFKEKHCVARKENALLVIRLLEAKFPDYQAVVPKEVTYHIDINRIQLLDAMRKMLILSDDRYRAVKVGIESDVMELISTNPDMGEAEEKVSIDFKGEKIEVGFNPRYFVDALQSMESESVSLGFIDNARPCIIEGEADKGFKGLIMPMRV
ncbi:MAG: DNA polymerase III subunit beta [Deltaproteobacteria bacterium]|nr:DNA polymerase III subunit beta [Deltaproteobacteria bacterium]